MFLLLMYRVSSTVPLSNRRKEYTVLMDSPGGRGGAGFQHTQNVTCSPPIGTLYDDVLSILESEESDLSS